MKFLPYMSVLSLLLGVGCGTDTPPPPMEESPTFSFGIVADAQYADKETAGLRHYRSSLESLEEAVADFNQQDLAFVVHLGDIIDEDFSSYDDILPIYEKIAAPHYIVLGNHEFSVDAYKVSTVPQRLGLDNRYYEVVHEGWRFIALDGQGLSTFAPIQGSNGASKAESILATMRKKGAANAFAWNGGIDSVQLQWLEERLDLAAQANEAVILFCHFPAFPLNQAHNIWNDEAVVNLIKSYPQVKAWFNGHNHAGYTGIHEGIHFITFKAMVNHPEGSTYSIAHVYGDRIVIEGKGAEDTRIIPIKGIFEP